MACCSVDGSVCPHNWDCPNATGEPRPRSLAWRRRYSHVPAENASPYRGQIFDAQEASAIEFIAYLVDRDLLSEWPQTEKRLVSEAEFERWFSAFRRRPTVPARPGAALEHGTEVAPVF